MVNYTVSDKSKSKYHDNYVDNVSKTGVKNCVSCWACIFCGKNKKIKVLENMLLCAKYRTEVAIVKGSGTCDSARSRFEWYNFISPLKKRLLEKTGFDFKAR